MSSITSANMCCRSSTARTKPCTRCSKVGPQPCLRPGLLLAALGYRCRRHGVASLRACRREDEPGRLTERRCTPGCVQDRAAADSFCRSSDPERLSALGASSFQRSCEGVPSLNRRASSSRRRSCLATRERRRRRSSRLSVRLCVGLRDEEPRNGVDPGQRDFNM
jgi:hypothetical protein